MAQPPLIAHIIFRLGIGGLENGLVNLINHMPADRYRHVIICLTHATDFRARIQRADVMIHELHKADGQDWGLYRRIWRLLRELQPDIVHTRNLSALEAQLPAWLVGVKARVHSEHGWDIFDPDGRNVKYQRLRRLFRPLISHYIALSKQLEAYLHTAIKVPPPRLSRICNGVDSNRFRPEPAPHAHRPMPIADFASPDSCVIGTIGRMHGVKDQLNLVQAFIQLHAMTDRSQRLRLVLVGDGPLREPALQMLDQHGIRDLAWLPGERNDVAELLRGFDIFVLPSRAEGISNTILEAMASGLPVVATDVGGNAELVDRNTNGFIVPPADPQALAEALHRYVLEPTLIERHAQASRARIEAQFSLEHMVRRYLDVYDAVLGDRLAIARIHSVQDA